MFAQLDLKNFNIVNACLGGFTLLFGIVSFLLKDKLYIAEPIPATLFGFIFREAHWAKPGQYGEVGSVSLDFSRLVLGIQLMFAGVHLPGKYLKSSWQSIVVLLVPVMTTMWIISSVIIFLLVPNITFLEALIIGSCITPTDPVLCGAIVNGKFADRYVTKHLQHIILAESGANDGFGYPFLFLALAIYHYSGTEIAKQWLVYTVCYEILLSVAYGAVIGFCAQEIMMYARKHKMIDKESYFLSAAAIALFIVGTAGLLGTDDLLACFIAGNLYTWNDQFRLDIEEDSLIPVLDLILNLGIFAWIGATVPWSMFNSVMPVWRFAVFGLCILIFRRLPALVLCYKLIPDIHNLKEALFAGFFGPIGVGALFYLQICVEELKEHHDNPALVEVATPLVYFAILTSIIVHGFSIPIVGAVLKYRERSLGVSSRTDATLVVHEQEVRANRELAESMKI